MDYSSIEKWNDDFEGMAIYSLVDENGKRYIGKSINLQKRLHQHRRLLNKVKKGKKLTHEFENKGLIEYVKNGGVLKVEILYKLDWSESCQNILRHYECYYCDLYGYENIYNDEPASEPNWFYQPFSDIELTLDFDKDDEVLKFLNEKPNINEYIKEAIRAYMK